MSDEGHRHVADRKERNLPKIYQFLSATYSIMVRLINFIKKFNIIAISKFNLKGIGLKTLQNVLQKHEINRQKVISSLDKNRELVAKKLVEEYVEFSYNTILDNITKAQVAFSENANKLLEIEKKELEQLDDFKTIKKTLIKELENLDDKIIVLDAIAIEKQQYQFDLKNLENDSREKREKLLEEHSLVKEDWQKIYLHWRRGSQNGSVNARATSPKRRRRETMNTI